MNWIEESLKRNAADVQSLTSWSSASNMDFRNKAGRIVGTFIAINWVRDTVARKIAGQIVMMDRHNEFSNNNLSICVDWIPNPRFAHPSERTYGCTLTNAQLMTKVGTARPLKDDEVVSDSTYTFVADECIPYKLKGEQL